MPFTRQKKRKSVATCFDDRALKTGSRRDLQRVAARKSFPPVAKTPSVFPLCKKLCSPKHEKLAKCPVT